MIKIRCKYSKLVRADELRPHPKNPNRHSVDQLQRLKSLIEYQGLRSPVIVSLLSGYIVAGHGRLEACKRLGMKEIPVDYQDFESEEQEYAHLVADNAIAEWAELNLSDINKDVVDLGPDFDIDLLGIKDFELEVADKYDEDKEDDVPEEPKEAISKLGDLYELGNHRLLCGDSTLNDDLVKLFGTNKCEITFTSPPYNLGENAGLRKDYGSGKKSAYLEKSDHKTQEEYLSFLNKFTLECLNFTELAFINIQLLSGNKVALSEYWYSLRHKLVDLMIWNKEHAAPQLAERVLNSVFEFVFIFSQKQNPSRTITTGEGFHGDVKNIFSLNPAGKKDPLAKSHGAVFPVQFAEYFITYFSKKSVYDPFGGSGSTLIACEKTNRQCFMMELEPKYIDVIVSRWCKYTGNTKVIRNNEEIEWPSATS